MLFKTCSIWVGIGYANNEYRVVATVAHTFFMVVLIWLCCLHPLVVAVIAFSVGLKSIYIKLTSMAYYRNCGIIVFCYRIVYRALKLG